MESLPRVTTRLPAAFALAVILVLSFATCAQAQTVDRSTLTGKLLCGYQGWFACAGDGNDPSIGFNHWAQGEPMGPGLYNTDVWPDVTEYSSEDLYDCGPGVTLTNGQPGYLFSSSKQGVTDTHFRWMQENMIDGVYLQRFLCGMGNPNNVRQIRTDGVLQNVMNSASTYGRTFAIEYDISGTPQETMSGTFVSDWTYLKSRFNIKNHPRYQYHNGKPVVIIWGVGIEDRPGTALQMQGIVNYFKSDGCFVGAGVAPGWRTLTGCKTDPAWTAVYNSFDAISPWTVGGYKTWNDILANKNGYWIPDIQDCNSRGVLYIPVAWPRFGWDNMNHLPCGTSVFPTRGGQHLWDQLFAQKGAGAVTQKIAMFDECDESTAILKMSDIVPVTGCWWTSEGLPHDWYLRLANYGGKMLRGDIALSQTMPISPTSSPDNATIVSDTIPTTMNKGQQYSVSITVQNSGETCWNAEFFKLGAVDDSDPFAATRHALSSQTVMPGQQTTFSFTMTAPMRNGYFISDWRMSHELISWFGAKLQKVIAVGSVQPPLNNSAFASSSDGWTITLWKAGTSGNGTMAYNSGAGNPSGGGIRCAGYSTTDNTDRCAREGGYMNKTIPTLGYRDIIVSYDLRVNALGTERTGAGTGTCTVDHNLIDEQLTVYYSTDGSTWTEADWLKRSDLKPTYQTYGTRYINLMDVTACDNNPSFALRFRWQLNTSGDNADLDNITVLGNSIDYTIPGPVTNFTALGWDMRNDLTWTNPTDADFQGTKILFRTTLPYPSGPNDPTATVAYDGAETSYSHTGLTNGVTYYYSAFAYDGEPNYSTAANASAKPTYVPPPGPVTNFKAYGGNGQTALSWTKPGDPNLLGIKIVYKENVGYPISWTDGAVAYNGLGTSYIHTGRNNGTKYYYSAYAYTSPTAYSGPAQSLAHAAIDATIPTAKSLMNNLVRAIRGNIVTAVFPTTPPASIFYIQDQDKPYGLKVSASESPSVGQKVDVVGTMSDQGAERSLNCAGNMVKVIDPGPVAIVPAAVNNKAVGGANIHSYAPGVVGGTGANNIGLLVRACGIVTQTQAGQYFYVDDGCGLKDGTKTGTIDNIGVRIKTGPPSGVETGNYVVVTGIVSPFNSSGLRPQILPLLSGGVEIVGP